MYHEQQQAATEAWHRLHATASANAADSQVNVKAGDLQALLNVIGPPPRLPPPGPLAGRDSVEVVIIDQPASDPPAGPSEPGPSDTPPEGTNPAASA